MLGLLFSHVNSYDIMFLKQYHAEHKVAMHIALAP